MDEVIKRGLNEQIDGSLASWMLDGCLDDIWLNKCMNRIMNQNMDGRLDEWMT